MATAITMNIMRGTNKIAREREAIAEVTIALSTLGEEDNEEFIVELLLLFLRASLRFLSLAASRLLREQLSLVGLEDLLYGLDPRARSVASDHPSLSRVVK